MTNLEAALAYARQGWQVLPIDPETKAPLIKGGVKAASSDEISVRVWWRDHPKANIGLATGAPGPDVLDVDDMGGAWEALAPMVPADTPYVETARGRHYYFVGTDQRTIGLGYGELRRQGSYVIAPPSVHASGKVYAWGRVGLPTAVAPEWVTAGRTTAGAGEAPVVTQVPPGEMYDHLLDFSVRLARGGVLDRLQRENALMAEFERVRVPGAAYGGDPNDTRRLASAPTEILERETNSQLTPQDIYIVESSVVVGHGEEKPSLDETSSGLPLYTALEMRETKWDVDWLVEGVMARGWSVMVTGREKVAGKGTLITYLLSKLERAEPTVFSPRAAAAISALVVSEEPGDALAEKYRKFGLTQATIIQGRDLSKLHLDWASTITLLVKVAVERQHGILYLDNVSRTSRADNDDESGVRFARRVEALADAATEAGLTLIVDHHNRKSGGKTEDRFRGGTALPGAMDNIINIERSGEWTSRRRVLSSRGRLQNTIWERTIELTPAFDDYTEVLGDDRLRTLASRDTWTKAELAEALGASPTTAANVLADYAEHVEKTDEKRGRADVWRVVDREELITKIDHLNDDLPEI